MKSTPSQSNTVMLIDDNEIDNYVSERVLKTSGFAKNVFVHTSAKSAIEFLRNIELSAEFPIALSPDYILLDLNLPFLDGFYFLDEFESLSNSTKSKTKIVILSCSIHPTDREKAKKYEYVADFFLKPILKEDLPRLNEVKGTQFCDARC